MNIRINQTYGQIAIRSYPAKVSIEQPRPEVSIEQPKAELTIETKHPKVIIDQTQCFAESGLKPVLQLARDFYKESFYKGLETIGRIADEGNRLLEIEYGGNPIVQIAVDNAYPEHEFNMVTMPQSRPKIDLDAGYVSIQSRPKPPKINWNAQSKAIINATHPSVDISMARYPSINIEYIGNKIDRQV